MQIWDSYPLLLGATPLEVYIDGISQFGTSISVLENSTTKHLATNKKVNNHQITNDNKVKSRTVSSIIIKNVGKVFINQDYIIDSTNLLRNETINIIIKDGIVDCIGSDCKDPEEISLFEIVDLCGGYVLPVSLVNITCKIIFL